MKFALTLRLLVACSILCLTTSSCKKDSPATPATNNTTNSNNNCNFTSNVLVADGVTKTIVSDSCRVFGSNYYTEHFADAGRTEAVAIIFDGTAAPAAGTYTAVNTITAVGPGHAYVEYYTAADAFQPANGNITVSDSGTAKIYSFCNFSCTNGTVTKSISIRSVCH